MPNRAHGGAIAFGSLTFDESYQAVLDRDGLIAWLKWLKEAQETPGIHLSDDTATLQNIFFVSRRGLLCRAIFIIR